MVRQNRYNNIVIVVSLAMLSLLTLNACGKKEVAEETTEVVETLPPETEPAIPLSQTPAETIENRTLPEASEDALGFVLKAWKVAKENNQSMIPLYLMEDTFSPLRKAANTASGSREELTAALGYDNTRNTDYYSSRNYPENFKTYIKVFLDKSVEKAVDISLIGSANVEYLDKGVKSLANIDKQISEAIGVEGYNQLEGEGVINPEETGFVTVTASNYSLYGFNYAFIDDKYDGFKTYVTPEAFKEVTENVDLVKLTYETGENLYLYTNRFGTQGDYVKEYVNSLTADYLKEDLDFSKAQYSSEYNGAEVICPDITAYVSDAHYEKFLNKLGIKQLYASNNKDFDVLINDAEAVPDLHALQSLVDVRLHITSGDLATITNNLPVDNIKKTKKIEADKNSVYILTDSTGEILFMGQIDPDYTIPEAVEEDSK